MCDFVILRELHKCGSEEMMPEEIPKLSSYFGLFSDFQETELTKPIDTSGVKDISYCYSNCRNLRKIAFLETFDVSCSRQLAGVFRGCSSFEEFFKIVNWDTSSNISLKETFRGSSFDSLRYLLKWNLDRCLTISYAFSNTLLTNLEGFNSLSIGNVKIFDRCFENCEQLVSLEGSEGLDLKNAISINFMFENCPNLSDISAFYTWKIPLRLINRTIFNNCPKLPKDWFNRFE